MAATFIKKHPGGPIFRKEENEWKSFKSFDNENNLS